MADNGLTPSENARIAASMVREEDLEELKTMRDDLQKKIDAARDDGRIFAMSLYVRLQAMVSHESDRIQRRFNRENLAVNRRAHKELATARRNGASA
jgi:hypothetical protein